MDSLPWELLLDTDRKTRRQLEEEPQVLERFAMEREITLSKAGSLIKERRSVKLKFSQRITEDAMSFKFDKAILKDLCDEKTQDSNSLFTSIIGQVNKNISLKYKSIFNTHHFYARIGLNRLTKANIEFSKKMLTLKEGDDYCFRLPEIFNDYIDNSYKIFVNTLEPLVRQKDYKYLCMRENIIAAVEKHYSQLIDF